MVKLLLILLGLVSTCVAIHGVGMVAGMRFLSHEWHRPEAERTLTRSFWLLVRVIYGLLILHLLQIAAWALLYFMLGCFADLHTALYFSATSYTTVGYGDVVLNDQWRMLGAVEAVTGVLMFGWSTGVLFSVVNHVQAWFFRMQHPPTPPAPPTPAVE